jgi:hypothetical protein
MANGLLSNIDPLSNSGTLRVGDVVAGRPGISLSAVRASLEAKVGSTVDIFFYNADEVTGSGANLRYTVTGFARFLITGVQSQGVDSQIRGYFVPTVLPGGEIIVGSPRGTMIAGLIQ